MGNIHYCMWNTIHGRFMWTAYHEGNHFAYHFTPLLVALSPITLLSAYPVPLVTSYVLALALCPLPIWHLARNRFGLAPWTAVIAGAWFVCNHFTASVQMANHFEVFYILFMLCTMACARDGGAAFWVFAALTLSVKEDAALWLLAYAAFEWFQHRRTELAPRFLRLGAVCVVYGGAALATMLLLASRQHGGVADYASRVGGAGFGADTAMTLGILAAATGFVALAGGRWLALALVPAPILLAGFPFTRVLFYYYSYPFLPWLAAATLAGLANLERWSAARPGLARAGAAWLVVVALVQVPLPTRTDGYRRLPFEVRPADLYRFNLMRESLPANAPVAIQFGLWGIVPTRPGMTGLSGANLRPVAWIVMDTASPHGFPTPDDFLSLARGIYAETGAGRRAMKHQEHGIFVVGPVIKPKDTR